MKSPNFNGAQVLRSSVTNVNPKFRIPSTPHKLINETKELNSYNFKKKV